MIVAKIGDYQDEKGVYEKSNNQWGSVYQIVKIGKEEG